MVGFYDLPKRPLSTWWNVGNGRMFGMEIAIDRSLVSSWSYLKFQTVQPVLPLSGMLKSTIERVLQPVVVVRIIAANSNLSPTNPTDLGSTDTAADRRWTHSLSSCSTPVLVVGPKKGPQKSRWRLVWIMRRDN